MTDDALPPLQDTPGASRAASDGGLPPLQDTPGIAPPQHIGMSHTRPATVDKPGAPVAQRFLGGIESGVLEANKLAAQFGLWLGHPGDKEDLAEANRLQQEHEAKVKEMAPSGPDVAHFAGEMADPLNFIPGPERAIKGVGTLYNVARGSLAGAKGGLTAPSQGTDNLKQKGKQVLLSAVGGAATAGAIPEMSPEAKLLVKEGVRLTPGMKATFLRKPEEAARSLPITGQAIGAAERTAREDFNKAIYNRVLAPIGQKYEPKGPIGYDGIDAVRGKLSQAYDRALQGTTFIANPPGMVPHGLTQGDLHDLNNILALMTRERRAQFDSIINQFYTQRVPANRLMDGETFKRIESELGTHARKFSKSDDVDQQSVGEALDEVVSLMRDAHMAQNPNKAAELQAVNRAYRLYVVAERGAGGRPLSNGVMTPGDFLGALKAMDSSVRKNRFSRGVLEMQDLARAGNTVMTPHLGSSGTAERSFVIDAAEIMAGTTGAHYLGVSPENIGAFIAGLATASVPYLRAPAGWPTANLGSVVGEAVDPVLQRAAPAVGSAAAQFGSPYSAAPAARALAIQPNAAQDLGVPQ